MPETIDRVVVAAVPASAAATPAAATVVQAAVEAAEGLVEVMLNFNLMFLGKVFFPFSSFSKRNLKWPWRFAFCNFTSKYVKGKIVYTVDDLIISLFFLISH